METVLLWTFGALYGAWLLGTVVRVGGYPTLTRLRVPQALWVLLPNWSLFAPEPGVSDFYVLYRGVSEDGAPGDWQTAYAPEPRRWFHGVWNPGKLQGKAVFDLVQQLAQATRQVAPDDLVRTAPYLHLLHFVRHQPHTEPHTQFCIVVREPAHDEEATLLVSAVHQR